VPAGGWCLPIADAQTVDNRPMRSSSWIEGDFQIPVG
jgi:hypothetical protein